MSPDSHLVVLDAPQRCLPIEGQPGLFRADGEHQVAVDVSAVVVLEEIAVVSGHRRADAERYIVPYEPPATCRMRFRGAPNVAVYVYGTFGHILKLLAAARDMADTGPR